MPFVLTACIISWSVWIPLVMSRRGIIPLNIPMPVYFLAVLRPIPAAVIHTWRAETRAGLKRLLCSLLRWRVPIRWYMIALGLPAVAALLATAVVWLVVRDGLEIEAVSALTRLSTFVLFFLVVLGEEVGWRG
ncbi:MAG: hypothetical protein V3T84_02750 [Phycisphaerales bacterium]